MTRLRLGFVLAGLLFLSACGVAQLPWASDERVQQAAYSQPGPSSITLITVVANGSNSGAHSALLINGSQRVMYDPAGTWYNKAVPERADMLYGMTPKMLQYYIDYHARKKFRVVMQKRIVSREAADELIRLSIENGTSANGFCAQNTSHLLSLTPGFEGFPVSIWPKSAMKGMDAIPGVVTDVIYQDDEGKDLKV
jgi:hypothetical protein